MRAALIALILVVLSVSTSFAGPGYYNGYSDYYGYSPIYAGYRNEAPTYYAGEVYPQHDGYRDYGYYPRSNYRRSRSNNLLGAALTIGLANEAFNHNRRSRRDIRGVATGMALIGALSR